MSRAAKVPLVVERPQDVADAFPRPTYRFSMDRVLLVSATVAFWAVVVTAIRVLAAS